VFVENRSEKHLFRIFYQFLRSFALLQPASLPQLCNIKLKENETSKKMENGPARLGDYLPDHHRHHLGFWQLAHHPSRPFTHLRDERHLGAVHDFCGDAISYQTIQYLVSKIKQLNNK
jgi:hypothetical protein